MNPQSLQTQIDEINHKLSLMGIDNLAGVVDVNSYMNYGVNDFSGMVFQQYAQKGYATSATFATIQTINAPVNSVFFVEARVVGIYTSGAGGSAGQSAGYVRRGTYYVSGAGVITLIGAVQDGYTAESDTNWDCTLTISGTKILVQAKTVANSNATFHSTILTKTLTL